MALIRGRDGLIAHFQSNGIEAVSWQQFLRIDSAERDVMRLRSDLQPREKFLSIKEMLHASKEL